MTTESSANVAHDLAEPSFLWVDTPVAHSFADASVAVLEGVVAFVAQSFAEPDTVSTPVPPCAYAFALNVVFTAPSTLSAQDFAEPSGTVVPSACSFAEYTPL